MGKIIDNHGNVVFKWDTQAKSFEFKQKTLAADINRGIEIPKFLQSNYNNLTTVVPPIQASQKTDDFDLFIRAVTEVYFKKQLTQHGYTIDQEGESLPPFAKKA